MNNYTVAIMESGQVNITIEADSEEEAIDLIRQAYENGEIEVFSDAEFEVL